MTQTERMLLEHVARVWIEYLQTYCPNHPDLGSLEAFYEIFKEEDYT